MVKNKMVPDGIICYKKIDGFELNLHLFTPVDQGAAEVRPGIVFFFGGGWAGGTPRQFYQQSRFFSERGFVAFSAEYRVSGTHKSTPFDCVRDGKSTLRWIRSHAAGLGVDPERIIASGGSAGGHVAACTGMIEGYEEEGEDLSISSRPNGMILFNPVLDTTKDGYGLDKFAPGRDRDISPCHHIRDHLPPTLVHHGTADTTVPFENAERFVRLMNEKGNRCDLVSFEGEGHGFFNGSFFRPENGDDHFDATMGRSLNFAKESGILLG